MGIENYLTFLIATGLFTLTPGIDTVFVLNKAMAYGRKAGFTVIAGITTGNMIHILLAAFGLSMIIARSPLAYTVLKYLGAGYMGYLGISSLFKTYLARRTRREGGLSGKTQRSAEDPFVENLEKKANNLEGSKDLVYVNTQNTAVPEPTIKQQYLSGFVTNIFNPKIPLFFISFFPQFISEGYENSPLPFIVLGSTLAFMGVVWFVFLTFCAGEAAKQLKSNPKAGTLLEILTGLVFIILALFMIIQN